MLDIERDADWERAIARAEWLARFLSMNFCGTYRLDDLEVGLAERVSLPTPALTGSTPTGTELHIASQLYSHGGHTRLLRSLLTEAQNGCDVLLTREAAQESSAQLLGLDPRRLLIAHGRTTFERVADIARVVSNYQTVFLHIHPDDVTCAVALYLINCGNSRPVVHFVNHSDHTFSVGLATVSTVLEISTFGWALRYERNTADRSSFVGLPIRSAGRNVATPPVPSRLLTAAEPYKYKPYGAASLPRVAESVLQRLPDAHLSVIGPRRFDYWWWPIRMRFPSRVRVQGRVSHPSYLDVLDGSGVFIDSYPITGGTAFTEALLHGCNVAGLLGESYGYGTADSLKDASESAFVERVCRLVAQDPSELSEQARIREAARTFHEPAAVRRRFEASSAAGSLLLPPPEFVSSVPFRSFEAAWSAESTIRVPGFRTRREAGLVFGLLARLFQAFGVSASRPILVLAKAMYARLRRPN